MTVDTILQCLDKVKKIGPAKWSACCPAHDSHSRASLVIRELDDGRVLLHDFGGCTTGEVLQAIGADFADLFPSAAGFHSPPVKRPFSAWDALNCLAFEALVLLQFSHRLSTDAPLTESERRRLRLSATRIQAAHGAVQ
jgi:hypothetical protein